MLSGEQFTISHGAQTATVVGVGGNLRSYVADGQPVTETWPDDVLAPRGCGAVLVPWPNRLRGGRYTFSGSSQQLALTEAGAGNAIHGLGRWSRYSLVSSSASAVTLGLDVVPQTGYPFELRVEVTYSLSSSGLAVTGLARNTGAAALPFGAGFHPYVHLHGHRLSDVSVRVPASEHLVVDSAQIPTGTEPVVGTPYDFRSLRALGAQRLDDGFTGLIGDPVTVQVRTPSGGADVWFDRAFTWTQVFTLADFAPGLDAVAVEPMSCPADAFNSGIGLVVLEPGESWTGTWGIRPL